MKSEEFDIEKYRKDNPMDYLKAIELINQDPYNPVIPETIYKITRLHNPDIIYKYYSLTDDLTLNEMKLNTLLKKQVYLASPSSMNDPFDSKAFFYRNEELKKIRFLENHDGKLIDDFSNHLRLSSFSKVGINNMPMWAHYANNHSGYCVSYDITKRENVGLAGSLFSVQYVNERIDITPIMVAFAKELEQLKSRATAAGNKQITINNFIIVWISVYYSLIKHSSWSYEQELRHVVSNDSPFTDAHPAGIYIGAKCSEKNRDMLINISRELNVPVFEMVLDEFSLKYELVSKIIQ